MLGSNQGTMAGNTGNTGFLSRLRSRNQSATGKKPVYTTGTRKSGISKKPKKTTATGPAPMSHHKTKPTASQKLHGAATVMKGKIHNNHQEVRAGEKEMQGKTGSSGLLSKGSARNKMI